MKNLKTISDLLLFIGYLSIVIFACTVAIFLFSLSNPMDDTKTMMVHLLAGYSLSAILPSLFAGYLGHTISEIGEKLTIKKEVKKETSNADFQTDFQKSLNNINNACDNLNKEKMRKLSLEVSLFIGSIFLILFLIVNGYESSNKNNNNEYEKTKKYRRDQIEHESFVLNIPSLDKSTIDSLLCISYAVLDSLEKAHFILEKDDFNKTKWYTHKQYNVYNHIYHSYLQAHVSNTGIIYLESTYHDNDLLFHEQIKVLVDSQIISSEIIPTYSELNDSEIGGGHIWEHISFVNNTDNGIIKAISENYNKPIKVRFVGKYNKDIMLNDLDKLMIKHSYDLSEQIKRINRLKEMQ